ncbi:type II secretion system F family protein [Yersinia hibernica]|uniref:General secretion pathway protein F n=1 Tax=Yersinia enterocolitica LC20 TaxID=1443113 RepID=A0A7U4K080_YEREN|nr:type II secretion system F family protein [Yersinia hibernica]AHM72328.1 type II secretion system protein F [Yersinia hibernica]
MPVFSYIAINGQGVKIKSKVEADNILAARHMLYQRKLYLLNIKIKHTSQRARFMSVFQTMSSVELVLITRKLSILVNAAIPLSEALELIEKQSEKSYINRAIYEVRKKILEGHSLSDSLSQFPTVFNSSYRSMIAAGEVSGQLNVVLSNLADHIEQVYKIKNKIIQALIYPLILVSISIGVIVILLSVIIPNIIEQFADHDRLLPLSTRILIVSSHWFEENVLFVMTAFVAFFLGVYGVSKIKNISMFFGFYYLKLPVLGKVIFELNISRYLRMMTVLNSNSVSLIKSMEISGAIVTNLYIKKQLENSVKLVSEGSSLSVSLANSHVFSPMVLHMVASGERSGQLNVILGKITDMQEQDLVNKISIFVTLLEPIIILFMAVFILFIVLAIFQPILEMNSMIL